MILESGGSQDLRHKMSPCSISWLGVTAPARRMDSWSEGRSATLGLRHGPRLYEEAAVGEYWTMGESLTNNTRVSEEGLRVVKLFRLGRSELVNTQII